MTSTTVSRERTADLPGRLAASLVQIAVFALSGVTAFLLRFEGLLPPEHAHHLAGALPWWVALKSVVFLAGGLDRGWWRFASIHDVVRLAAANILGSACAAVAIAYSVPPGFPRSLYLLDFLLSLLGTSALRVGARLAREPGRSKFASGACQRILIYGAGCAGVTLLREIRTTSRLACVPRGFVDDDSRKRGALIHGLRVLGNGGDLPQLVAGHRISEVLIAVPSAPPARMTAILRACQQAGVRCRTVPALAGIIEGRGLASQVREIDEQDLLGRSPVRVREPATHARLRGHVALVTGAAGSIGAELCRQIARFQPRAIVGFDVAETALFFLEREMRSHFPGLEFCAEIGNIQNGRRLAEVFARHRPSIVYHAAAYKHVPLMEAHLFEAVENNILGTWEVAAAAADHGVLHFVLISSDKAVRPANIMGATKRVAELIIQSWPPARPHFAAVRFGNVLGSNGSLVPILKRQIASGGPVTVTHPEMTRYFMTIPEAAQLVLQASTMGRGGEIFLLEMGEPVRILDLAKNLIRLSGLQPEEDIRIELTGIRPGEKLYEELQLEQEHVLPTGHEKIKMLSCPAPPSELAPCLVELREACSSRDEVRLIAALRRLVPEYSPGPHILGAADPSWSRPRNAAILP